MLFVGVNVSLSDSYILLFLSPPFSYFLLLSFRLSLFLSISLPLLSLLPFFFLPFFPIIIPQLLFSKLHDFQSLVPLAVPLQAHPKSPSSSLCPTIIPNLGYVMEKRDKEAHAIE